MLSVKEFNELCNKANDSINDEINNFDKCGGKVSAQLEAVIERLIELPNDYKKAKENNYTAEMQTYINFINLIINKHIKQALTEYKSEYW